MNSSKTKPMIITYVRRYWDPRRAPIVNYSYFNDNDESQGPFLSEEEALQHYSMQIEESVNKQEQEK